MLGWINLKGWLGLFSKTCGRKHFHLEKDLVAGDVCEGLLCVEFPQIPTMLLKHQLLPPWSGSSVIILSFPAVLSSSQQPDAKLKFQ